MNRQKNLYAGVSDSAGYGGSLWYVCQEMFPVHGGKSGFPDLAEGNNGTSVNPRLRGFSALVCGQVASEYGSAVRETISLERFYIWKSEGRCLFLSSFAYSIK